MASSTEFENDLRSEVGKTIVGSNESGAGTRSNWQHESYKEEFELRVSDDLRLDGTLMRQAMKAGKAGDWADLVKSGQARGRESATAMGSQTTRNGRVFCSRLCRGARKS